MDSSASGDVDETEGVDDPGSGGGASGGGGWESGSSGGDDDGSSETGDGAGACGDGWLDDAERCDDGNLSSGDGCESDCTQTIGVQAFAVGGAHTCALSFEGAVRCFGSNTRGQLGIGSTEVIGDDETPLEADDTVLLPVVRSIAAGRDHSCAVSVDHGVYCWGDNAHGQLGLGHTDAVGDDPFERPQRVALDEPVNVVVAGATHTCALLYGGAVRCWGGGASGQLGVPDFYGSAGAGEAPYAEVADAPNVGLEGVVVRGLSAGAEHTCVVDAFGEAYCWGAGGDGRLGIGTDADISTPRDGRLDLDAPARTIVAAARHGCAVSTGYELSCFGHNDDGQLGLGHTDAIGDDEGLAGAEHVRLGEDLVLSVALTDTSSCALTHHGTVFCWGASDLGQLGYGMTATLGDAEPPVDWPAFAPVKLSRAATEIDAGREHVCARTDDARLRCWGNARLGRLGQGSIELDAYGDDPDEREPPVVRIFR